MGASYISGCVNPGTRNPHMRLLRPKAETQKEVCFGFGKTNSTGFLKAGVWGFKPQCTFGLGLRVNRPKRVNPKT